jgi:hypothetical protein
VRRHGRRRRGHGLRLIHGIATAGYFDPAVQTGTAAAVMTSFWAGLDATIAGIKAHADLTRAANLGFSV